METKNPMCIGQMIELHDKLGIDFDINDGMLTLRARLAYTGKSVSHLARRLGKSRQTTYDLLNDPKNMTCRQVEVVVEECELTDDERKWYFGF